MSLRVVKKRSLKPNKLERGPLCNVFSWLDSGASRQMWKRLEQQTLPAPSSGRLEHLHGLLPPQHHTGLLVD